MSLTRLARRTGVSTSYLCRIEREDGRRASDRLLRKLARVLGLPVDEAFVSARRLAPEVVEWLVTNPDAVRRIRAEMQEARA